MRQVHEVIVVEGKYDKNTVKQAVNCTVLETSGFGIFSDTQKLSLLRLLAEKRGVIILTDSDRAGFFIRGRLGGMLGGLNVKHAYIPDIKGRERRKTMFSKDGKLGVEGMERGVIIKALERAGATFVDEPITNERDVLITRADMYEAGISGKPGSAALRRKLLVRLGLPERISSGGLLDVLNALYTRSEFLSLFSADDI